MCFVHGCLHKASCRVLDGEAIPIFLMSKSRELQKISGFGSMRPELSREVLKWYLGGRKVCDVARTAFGMEPGRALLRLQHGNEHKQGQQVDEELERVWRVCELAGFYCF